jgi:hypothetical protein
MKNRYHTFVNDKYGQSIRAGDIVFRQGSWDDNGRCENHLGYIRPDNEADKAKCTIEINYIMECFLRPGLDNPSDKPRIFSLSPRMEVLGNMIDHPDLMINPYDKFKEILDVQYRHFREERRYLKRKEKSYKKLVNFKS